MSEGDAEILSDPWAWAAANGLPPPPPITPDSPAAAATLMEWAARVLVLAANRGDGDDAADGQKAHAEREMKTADAQMKFPANEESTAKDMQNIGQQGSQLAQQLPQMVGGLAGAISGALGGALQPLSQIPQQLAQTGQQLLQQGMGAVKAEDAADLTPADLTGQGLGADLGSGGGGTGEAGGGIGGTSPTAMLGPPATPSATTAPTSGRAMPPVPAAPAVPATGQMGGMGGMPMMPHGGMHGGAEGKSDKTDTKRVSVPAIKNGAPVQGRISTPAPAGPTVSKNVDGKPVSTRRIVIPTDKVEDRIEDDEAKGR